MGILRGTPLNIDFGINNIIKNCKIGSVGGITCRKGEGEWRWGNMVDGLYIHIWNRTMKPLAVL
jgi:hypothetical protein